MINIDKLARLLHWAMILQDDTAVYTFNMEYGQQYKDRR